MMNINFKSGGHITEKARQNYLDMTTRLKIADATKCLQKERKDFKKIKWKLEDIIGRNSSKFRNIMRKLSEENKAFKEKMKTKYEKKVERIETKHKAKKREDTKLKLPEEMMMFNNLSIFR